MLDQDGNFHIFTTGVIGDDYGDYITAQLAKMPADAKRIVHHIQSPGGSCTGGYNGYHALLSVKKPIHSIIEGQAESMATFLATLGTSEIHKPSSYMIHNPFYPKGISGDADAQKAGEENLRNIENEMAEAYSKKTGKPIEEIKMLMKKQTHLTAEQAVKMGFVDKLVVPENAYGLSEIMKEIKETFADLKNLFKGRAAAQGATAVDVALKDGTQMKVEPDLAVGATAMVGDQKANGVYELENGKIVTCADGVITEIKDAVAPPAPPAEESLDALQKQMADIQNKIAAKQAAEQAKQQAAKTEAEKALELIQAKEKEAAEAKRKAEEAEKALALKQKEIEELKKKTVGNADPDDPGLPNKAAAIGGNHSMNLSIAASRSFLAAHMPGMERYYKQGKFKDGTRFIDYRPGGPMAVNIIETDFNYTWDGVLDLDLFYKPTLGTPAPSDLATIDTGAQFNKRYHLVPSLSNVLKPYTGCDQPTTGSRLILTSKEIQLKKHQMFEGFCVDDFTGYLTGVYNVLAQEWVKSGNEQFDPAGTPIDRLIMDALKDALRRDFFRRICFSDISSTSDNYNQIDGMWSNLIKDSGASNYCVFRSNAASAFGTGDLSSNAAANAFKAMYKNSNNLLKQEVIDKGVAVFWTTRSIWDNYYDDLVATGSVSDGEYENYLKGIKTLTFRGIPVKPVTFWDECLKESTNPLFSTTRHLIMLTIKENHIFGIENTSDLGAIKSWFSDDDNKRYYRANMTFGYQKIHCDLTTIAY